MPDQKKLRAPIAAGIAGGTVFLVFLFILNLGIPLAALAGLAALAAGYFLFRPSRKTEIVVGTLDVSNEMLDQVLKEGRQKLDQLKKLTAKITVDSARDKAQHICELTGKILDDITQDPKDIKPERQFLNYYLDATLKILKRYVDLSRNKVTSGSFQDVLSRVENTLGTLVEAYEKQLSRLMEDDVMDLETEIAVLDNMMKMENLGTKKNPPPAQAPGGKK
jgi:5-bromo-4-chloroindolyl phosphate hydrolysis protein